MGYDWKTYLDRYRKIGTAVILSIVTGGYLVIWWLLQDWVEKEGLVFPANKSFALGWFGFILLWAWIAVDLMVKGELFEINSDVGRVGLLIGLGYILSQVWAYC